MTPARPAIIEYLRSQAQETTPKQAAKNNYRSQMQRDPRNDLFLLKPADQWLKEEYSKPEARQLLGTLWHEQELCILFADTNLGKSILAVQIGYNLAKQSGMEPFGSQLNEGFKVLYIDFELSAAQFKARYTHPAHGIHHFGQNFIRAEFNPAGDDPLLYDKYEDYVKEKIESAVIASKANVLIIDNISCIGGVANYAGAALAIMKTLKALKIKHKLSILVLAHTPKRKLYNPITENDLQGSKMIINFADSAFAIGQSQQDASLLYLKQIKQRNTGSDYGAAHVCLFCIGKQQSFLRFEFAGFDNERAHLQKAGVALSAEILQRIPELSRQGLSIRKVANHLKISAATVRRVLERMKEGNRQANVHI